MEYEIHITVECNDIEQFKNDCNEFNVKPILIGLNISNQLMTSSKHMNNNYICTLNDLKNKLLLKKYNILRTKVEKRPDVHKDENFIYYESHIRLKLSKNFDMLLLENICTSFNFHISRNLFKNDDIYDYRMITYRNYKLDFNIFSNVINQMKITLEKYNILYDKIEIEECIHDSNVNLDKDWIK
jgi:hypothetical protein